MRLVDPSLVLNSTMFRHAEASSGQPCCAVYFSNICASH